MGKCTGCIRHTIIVLPPLTEKLAKELKLNLGPSEKPSIATFGANQSTKLQCKSSKLQVYLKDGSFMPIDVIVVPSITGRITRTPLSSTDVKNQL